ncbi:MAG TPA: divergent polysaccharide deacetylase family protein [Candidatus Acidoferrales bacterium]
MSSDIRTSLASGLTLLSCLFGLLFFGCAKKPAAKTDLRAVTTEVVAAAQKLTNNTSRIAVRPQIQTSPRGGSAAVDDIYVSLANPSQASSFEATLKAIARRHGLTVTSAWTSAGVTRFDYSFNALRTHSIHVVLPISARNAAAATHLSGKGRAGELAIIIDDMGYDRSAADAVIALPFPLTVSVLPHLPVSSEIAEEAFRRGDEVLLHLPMQSESEAVKAEEIELRVGMNPAQVSSAVEGMLDTVPHVVGVNNHQGSRATSDVALMQALMPVLRGRGLFFIDSRTDAKTVAYDMAKRDGVRAASRKIFLDDVGTRTAIVAQLELAARDASRDGFAIAIGHPRPATIAALAEEVPRLEARGIHLVFASDVVK